VDPCATRERVIVNDPERDSALAVLSLWYESFGDRAMPLGELTQHASQELKDCLLAVSADRDNLLIIDTRRLGTWCSKIEDRVYGEFRLTRDGTAQRAVRWKVSRVSSVSPNAATQNGATHTPETDLVNESMCASANSERQEINSPDSLNSPSQSGEEDEGIDV